MSLKHKLNRYKSHLIREGPGVHEPSTELDQMEIPYLQQWAEFQAKPYIVDGDYIFVREVKYPLNRRHGTYTFQQLEEVVAAWEKSGIEHPLSAHQVSPSDLLFFDTETTGLHGGAGNTIFLLGYSRIEQDAVVVRQHFLPQPHAEAVLYQSFLADTNQSTHLVTYNGKSFDWPQVKTRHTMHRDQLPQLPSFGHLDLLHGARRLWKDELESCRLAVIEQEKLQISRESDVPGYMAPILYVDYLNNQDPDTIKGVLKHNEMDVLSLISLYIHLSSLLISRDHTSLSPTEQYEIARWYDALGQLDRALRHYRQVAGGPHHVSGKAMTAMAAIYKKQKKYQQALHCWEKYLQSHSTAGEEIYIEIAKIYEHHYKDYERALYYTKLAYQRWQQKRSVLRSKSKAEGQAYQKRMERLETKSRSLFTPT